MGVGRSEEEPLKLREGFLASALLPAPRLLIKLVRVLQQIPHLGPAPPEW